MSSFNFFLFLMFTTPVFSSPIRLMPVNGGDNAIAFDVQVETVTIEASVSTTPEASSTSASSSLASSIPPVITTAIETAFVTAAPATITSVVLQMPPTTVTQIMTVMPTTPPTPAYSHVPSSTWSLPAQFTALDCFKIDKFADGQTNLAVVTGVPGSASATISVPAAQPTTSVPTWNNDTDAVIRLLYPAGSVNPGSELQGGVDLYANPLPMTDAHNVTMEYSVFIDKDFDFVKGGKLPGLYGGHMGCSGGNIANDCFSTRLMWRPDGAGELYLYAEQSKQLPSLCSTPPLSVCDSDYGLSIGRGSFHWARGQWTHVRQTVRLNTPGIQDGGFTLDVNGNRVITLDSVFYRDVKPQDPMESASHSGLLPTHATQHGTVATPPSTTSVPRPTSSGVVDGLLGGLLGGDPANGGLLGGGSNSGLLGGLLGRVDEEESHPKRSPVLALLAPPSYATDRKSVSSAVPFDLQEFPPSLSKNPASTSTPVPTSTSGSGSPFASAPLVSLVVAPVPQPITIDSASDAAIQISAIIPAAAVTVVITTTALHPTPRPDVQIVAAATDPNAPASFGFSGIFFSSFFGGHDASWATPRDQYMWFKDFALAVNN